MNITDLKLFHGTTSDNWNPNCNMGYLYVTTHIEHAKYHAKDRVESEMSEGIASDMVLIMLNNECLSEFKLLPDNDVDESNGYETWQESLKEIGTLILVGDTRKLKYHSKILKLTPSSDLAP
ncbi:hypothetical protein ACXHQ0_19380 [Vibrio antiquarius]|uniref:Uncharacterized protein n=1 Tax=Vibrio parahaemolyticus TaxID=670 RepID=A0AA46ZA82_VIBPH|nr:hypothetical protein [Vibrio parahaemolyticus]EGR3230064.1 hypothetical protein [Vibrio parahaemolyticus]EGR5928018.1 hypothetical protein [Vibrio parahaemolyticus]EJG0181104.1 hypothetical protein [Vibrio parahaemolyticus]KOE80231.1 hypothetical protein ACS91_23045 [Vibrio parahaemolyticus]KOY37980.1 hypothetical protein ACX10_12090 [Vibrio parahaemolyticus]